jgi:sodium-independent organic anion transporter
MAFARQDSLQSTAVQSFIGEEAPAPGDELPTLSAAAAGGAESKDDLLRREESGAAKSSLPSAEDLRRTVRAQMESDATELEDENMFTRSNLAFLCTSRWFGVCLCLFVLTQSAIVNGLFYSSVSTIERRYFLSSSTAGLIIASYDIAALVVSTFIGFYGGKSHVPRWLGSGFLLLCVGTFVFISPHAFGGLYEPKPVFTKFCEALSGEFAPQCESVSAAVVPVFFVGMVIIAIGAAPLYALGPAYLDKIVKPKVLTVYLGYFYAAASIGPLIGFGLSAIFLDVWIEEPLHNAPPGMSPGEVEWLGAWWIGYGIAATVGIWFALAFFMFPRYLPNTRQIREDFAFQNLVVQQRQKSGQSSGSGESSALGAAASAASSSHPSSRPGTPSATSKSYHPGTATGIMFRNESEEQRISDSLWLSLRYVLSNKPFMLTLLGQSSETFAIAGFAAFLPKMSESLFRLRPAEASYTIGAVIIPGAAAGVFVGGVMQKKLRSTLVQIGRYMWIFALISLGFVFVFFIHCPTVKLAGINRAYAPAGNSFTPNNNTALRPELYAQCNVDCNCDPDRYDPVCGSDGVTYFSACHAGCLVDAPTDSDVYGSCTCVNAARIARGEPDNLAASTGALGKCGKEDCGALPWFLALLFFLMFFTFLNHVPSVVVQLRSLSPLQRHFGMGLQNVVFRLLGAIPGPIIFGALIDRLCILQARDCLDEVGSCLEYSNAKARIALFLLAAIPKALSVVFFFLAYRSLGAHVDVRVRTGFRAADFDRDGRVTREEVYRFLQTEKFLGNPQFQSADLKSFTDRVMRIFDTNSDGAIARAELYRALDEAAPEVKVRIANAVTQITVETRRAAIRAVFDALDTNRDGKLDKREVMRWLKHEPAWVELQLRYTGSDGARTHSTSKLREQLYKQIDQFRDGLVTPEELEDFFRNWTIEDILTFSSDQLALRAASGGSDDVEMQRVSSN